MSGAVVGLDVGSSGTRALAYDEAGRVVARAAVPYELRSSGATRGPHRAELAVAEVLAAVDAALATVLDGVRARGMGVEAIGLATAMHGLVAVDGGGAPLTPLLTWADLRAAAVARDLARLPAAAALVRRTGVPLHPMSPLAKLRWFHEHEPSIAARAARWRSLKDVVVAALTGADVVDESSASGTGLFDVRRRTWDEEALALAGVTAEQLARPVPVTTVVPTRAESAGGGVPLVVGGGDGPLASLGAGAVLPGVGGCTVGTSGALRMVVAAPRTRSPRLFCYVLDEARWVVGGATNSAGLVVAWLHRELTPLPRPALATWLEALLGEVPPGADGVTALPHLGGERAPQWDPDLRGAITGLSLRHGRGHLARAVVDGVAYQLRLVADELARDGLEALEWRVSGRLTEVAAFRQLLADVLRVPVAAVGVTQPAAFGAALLAGRAIGRAMPAAPVTAVHTPHESHGGAHEEAYDRFRALASPDAVARGAPPRDAGDATTTSGVGRNSPEDAEGTPRSSRRS